MSHLSEVNPIKQEKESECRACLQKLEPDSLFYNLFDCWPDDADSLGRSIAEDLSSIAGILVRHYGVYLVYSLHCLPIHYFKIVHFLLAVLMSSKLN